jgi:hypothetical protein
MGTWETTSCYLESTYGGSLAAMEEVQDQQTRKKVEEVGGRHKGYKKKNEILVRDRMDIKELSVGF